MNEEAIPYFDDKENKFLPDKPIVERYVVNAIVLNRAKNEILCLQWHDFKWNTFVNGGIDEGEDAVIAAMREIKEETGYTHVRFMCELGKAKSRFYMPAKEENRIAHATGMLFELTDEDRDVVDEEETKKHISVWVPVDDVSSFVNIDWQLYLWEKALEIIESKID